MVLTIVLVVWVAVIPACVIALLEIVARKRCAERKRASAGGAGPPGQLLRFAPPLHGRRREHVPSGGYGAVMRSSSSASGRRPGSGPRLRLDRTR
jgi:hypothetical protein